VFHSVVVVELFACLEEVGDCGAYLLVLFRVVLLCVVIYYIVILRFG
jgi:hypothetical protein